MKMILLAFFMSTTLSLQAIDWFKVEETPPDWMVAQIEEDLAPFTKELKFEALDQFFNILGESLILTRVRIRNGEVNYQFSNNSSTYSANAWIIDGLEKLSTHMDLPDVDFIFACVDTINNNPWNAPIFFESKLGNIPGILFPDRWALRGYVPEKVEVLIGNTQNSWEGKIPVLFFRGSDTCRDSGVNWCKWDQCARVRLMRLSRQRPDFINAKFYWGLHNYSKMDQAHSEGLITMDYYPLRDHPRYKYLMDLDGNCASCPRTAAIFHSNSVVFKEVSPSKQWWYRLLIPYVHYVPVAGDLSDAVSQVEWARNNDDLCRTISDNGRNLVLDVLSEERIYQYLYHLLVAYSNKQKLMQ